jgi:citrate synthase
MAGGALRRKMIGNYSKERLLAELKLKESRTGEEWTQFEAELDEKVAEYRGKYKEYPEVEVYSGIVFYPKDGSFSFKKDA